MSKREMNVLLDKAIEQHVNAAHNYGKLKKVLNKNTTHMDGRQKKKHREDVKTIHEAALEWRKK